MMTLLIKLISRSAVCDCWSARIKASVVKVIMDLHILGLINSSGNCLILKLRPLICVKKLFCTCIWYPRVALNPTRMGKPCSWAKSLTNFSISMTKSQYVFLATSKSPLMPSRMAKQRCNFIAAELLTI